MDNNPYSSPETHAGYGATPGGALTPKEILFSFKGRISRSVFWIYTIAAQVAFIIIFGIIFTTLSTNTDITVGDGATESVPALSLIAWVIFVPIYILTIYCSFAIQAKRWHDRDKSAWWILIAFVPIIGGFWTLIECGFLKGTEGANNYGNDPLETP